MKKVSRLIALLLAVTMLLGLLSACVENGGKTTITITADSNTLEQGDGGVKVTVTVDPEGGAFDLTVDKDVVELVNTNSKGTTIRVKEGITIPEDTVVTLTAKLTTDSKVSDSKQFTVKANSAKTQINLVLSPDTIMPSQTSTVVAVASVQGSITIKATGPNADLVKINGNTVVVVGDITMDTDVTIVATLDSDPTVTAQKTLTIKGPNSGDWIKLESDRYTIDSSSYAVLNIAASGAYTVTHTGLSNVTYNPETRKLSVFKDVTEAMQIEVTATLNDVPSVKSTIKITLQPPVVPPEIKIETANNVTVVEKDKDLDLTVTVSTGDAYDLTVSDEKLAVIKTEGGKNKLSVVATDIAYDKTVTVTATLRNNPDVKVSKSFIVKAPRKNGELNGLKSKLTTDTFTQAGAKKLTVSGILTDYYEDFHVSNNNSAQIYEILVKMEEGKWYGKWNVKDSDNVNENSYIKDSETVTIGGQVGNIMKMAFISKDNVVTYKSITDYRSVPALWQNQHLWNHFGEDNINNYTFIESESKDKDYDVYEFTASKNEEWVLYYLTYMSYAYTPVLEDTLDRVYLKVNSNNEIIGMIAYTEFLYYGSDTREDADAMSYTKLELDFTFAEQSTETLVPDPQPYTAPQHADKLQAAIDKMKAATNYTFSALDTTTYAPSGNDDDYTISSAKDAIQTLSLSGDYVSAVSPFGSNGGAGLRGYVTDGAILLERTTKYTATMDGKEYAVEYYGYKAKKVDEKDYYDFFDYNKDTKAFEGTQQYLGKMKGVLPAWSFSANVFEFVKSGSSNGSITYEFRLRDSSITRDIALQVSMHSYATDGASSATNRLSIVVDDKGNVLTTVYPYSINQGTYLGYITTTYSNIGTTEIDAKEFEDYKARVVSPLWAARELKYYYPDHDSKKAPSAGTGETILKKMFGDDWEQFPKATVFTDAFGDRMSPLFFEYREVTDASGNLVGYDDYFSFNADTDDYDENMQITNETYDRIIDKLTEGLTANGFVETYRSPVHDAANRNSRIVLYLNESLGCQIRVENNHTKNFFIDVGYKGFWVA